MHLSVIIPAYNEEKRLAKTLNSINDYLLRQNYESEILVVDNGSTDNTAGVVRMLEGKINGLRLVSGQAGQGKGYAVKIGMLQARGEYRLFTDADNSTSIDQVEKMWPYFAQGYNIVIGSRDIKGAVLDPPQPFLRKVILGEGFKLYRKLIIGLWGIEDTQCGFKAFSKEAAEKIFPLSRINYFSFDPEILILAKKFGFKIKEIPIKWINDPDSKVGFGSIFSMAVELFKLKINLIKGLYEKKPSKI